VHELIAQAVQARLRDQSRDVRRPTIGLGPPPSLRAQMPLHMPADRDAATWSGAPLRLVDSAPAADDVMGRSPSVGFPTTLPPLGHRPTTHDEAAAPGFFAALRAIGQVFEGYLVC